MLPENFVISKFYQYVGSPKYNRGQGTYQGSCPICREGKSWLKKRRCYFLVKENIICCHNCGWYSKPIKWIEKLSGDQYFTILRESKEYTSEFTVTNRESEIKKVIKVDKLPEDCIDLLDVSQFKFYKDRKIVSLANELIKDRRLDTAINRPKSIYLSLTDRVHSNRLIIPFDDINSNTIFYQSRTILNDDDRPKYLSKVNSERSLYGIDKIDPNIPYIFILEGPIDAFFVKNGVAVAGINESKNKIFTNLQFGQLNSFPLHEKIFVLDNQYKDFAAKQKSKYLLDKGYSVFIWPENLIGYKDINDICVDRGIDSIDSSTIIENTYTGLKGKMLLSQIN